MAASKLKLKKNFDLFERMRKIRSRLQVFNDVVANDQEVTMEELQSLKAQMKEVRALEDKWWADFMAHVRAFNKEA